MKRSIGVLATLIAGLLTTSCDSSQGLFHRRKSSEQTTRTPLNQRQKSDSSEQRSQSQNVATDERQAQNKARGEDLSSKSSSLKETLQAKSRQIKAAIEGPNQAESSTSRHGTDPPQAEVADPGVKDQHSAPDTTNDAAGEARIRQRLGLSMGSDQQKEERYSDNRRNDRPNSSADSAPTNERELNPGANPANRPYGTSERSDTRRDDDLRPNESDRPPAASRFAEQSRPATSDRYRDSRQDADERAIQDRYPGQSGGDDRYRRREDRYPAPASDRDDADRSRRMKDDRTASDDRAVNDRTSRSTDESDRRREEGNTDRYASDRQQLADRISEQVDALEQHLDSLDQIKGKSSVKARPVRQGLGKELEKQRDELIKVYYQVQRGSAQNWKQIKRQADRLIYDAEEKLEQMTVTKRG